MLEQHEQQLFVCVEGSSSHAEGLKEAKRTTIRKAVRRQVSEAVPLDGFYSIHHQSNDIKDNI